MTTSTLDELLRQLEVLQAAIEAERARIREEEAAAEAEPIIKRLGIWNHYLGPLPVQPLADAVDEGAVAFRNNGWSVASDEYSGYFYGRVFDVRNMLLRSEDRVDRIGARLNPMFIYRWVTVQDDSSAEDIKFVQNNYNIAQLTRPFFDMSFRYKSMPSVYADWVNGENRWSWNKNIRPTPVAASLLPTHKLIHAGNGGLERARKKFEDFWDGPEPITFAHMFAKAQTKAHDFAWAALKDDEVRTQFLEENPWYEPAEPFTPVVSED